MISIQNYLQKFSQFITVFLKKIIQEKSASPINYMTCAFSIIPIFLFYLKLIFIIILSNFSLHLNTLGQILSLLKNNLNIKHVSNQLKYVKWLK